MRPQTINIISHWKFFIFIFLYCVSIKVWGQCNFKLFSSSWVFALEKSSIVFEFHFSKNLLKESLALFLLSVVAFVKPFFSTRALISTRSGSFVKVFLFSLIFPSSFGHDSQLFNWLGTSFLSQTTLFLELKCKIVWFFWLIFASKGQEVSRFEAESKVFFL